MNIDLKHIEKLLEELSVKSMESLDHHGFGVMSEGIEGITQRYLYEKIFKRWERAKSDNATHINLNIHKIDTICRHLGYRNYMAFKLEVEANSLSEELKSCVGTWRSYVRRSTKKGSLYSSPVKIYLDKNTVHFMLRGPQREFYGTVKLKSGCLFLLMESEDGKEFHHVYKLGRMLRADVLQGIFSGVLTANEPIGGRTVLIREKEGDFDRLENEELDIERIKTDDSLIYRRLAQYFEGFNDNNLRIQPVNTFTIDDIGDCD